MTNIDFFDKIAPIYDDLYTNNKESMAETNTLVRLIAKWSNPKSTSLLDLGCGTGLMLEHASFYAKNLKEYTGIDISSGMIDILRKKFKSTTDIKLNSIVGDINNFTEYIPKYQKFDICLSTFGSFSYIDDLETSFSEIRKRLNPKGLAVLMFYSCIANPDYKTQCKDCNERILNNYSFRNAPDNLSHSTFFYSKKILKQFLNKANISDYHILGINHKNDSYDKSATVKQIEDLMWEDMNKLNSDKAHSTVVLFKNH